MPHPRDNLYRRSWVSPVAAVLIAMVFVFAGFVGGYVYGAAGTRLSEPRIAPLPQAEWNADQTAILQPYEDSGRLFNVFTTMARHPELAEAWLGFGRHILSESTLPPRERELAILRIGWLCQAEYEWAQHARLGLAAGLTDEEIARITQGPDAEGWSDFDVALLTAVDQLHQDAFITDSTWNALAARYDEKQMMDFVFTVGQYNLVSMALNSFGVQLDPGLEGFPK